MPNYRRVFVRGATYFFTVKTYHNRPWLIRPDVRNALRQAVLRTRLSFPFYIDAWVVLPDHMHCIWRLPDGDANFPARWSCIKRLVTRACQGRFGLCTLRSGSQAQRGEGMFWQRRFWEHLISDEADYRRHIDYVHWNPVKHGYVGSVVEWPYSTFHRFVAHGIYSPDWGGRSVRSCAGKDFGE